MNQPIIAMISTRKQSYDAYDDPSEQISPPQSNLTLEQISHNIQQLTRNYSPSLHAATVINFVHRCHIPQLVQSYTVFQLEYHPELEEPRVSGLYGNECFQGLMSYHGVEEEQPGGVLFMPPLPKTINASLDALFNAYGYIPHFQRFLMFYPAYLEQHLAVQKALLDSDKIDVKITYFLALCAAAEKGSVYMMARYLKRFFRSGGELQWLTKGTFPNKLKKILRLNRAMSHAPWQITPDLIIDILQNESFRWSINELALIVQILAFAHHDATIALALGLQPEESERLAEINLEKILEIKEKYDGRKYAEGVNVQKHEEMLPVVEQMEVEEKEETENEAGNSEANEINRESPVFKPVSSQSQFTEPYMKAILEQINSHSMTQQINQLLQPMLEPYQSFPPPQHSLDYSDYNYKFMAYPILHNLTQSIADKLQALIQCAQNMTRGNFGSQQVHQTKEFRKAVRYYGQNICGYTHQQYDYEHHLAAFLTSPVKFYIRLLMLSPLHIGRQVLGEIHHEGGQIECFDLGHIAILSATARMSLELTQAVQAFEL